MSKHKTRCALRLYCCIAQTQILNKLRVALYNNAIAYSRELDGKLLCRSVMMQQYLEKKKKKKKKKLSLAAFDQ